MLLELNIQYRPIFERPFDHVRFRRRAFDVLTLVQFSPEAREVLQFDQVPDGR